MNQKFKVEERLVLELVPDYWLPLDPNVPDEFIMLGTTEAATVRTLMSRRELEVSDQWQTDEALQALDKIKGVDVFQGFSGGEFYFMIHTKKPPTDCIHFRKAMAYAFDYETVPKYLFPGSVVSRGPIPHVVPGFNPNVYQYKRDLAKAKEELKKSKYYGKLDQYPIEVHWVAEVPDEEKVALMFMSNMAEIGINVKVVKVPWMSVVEETAAIDTSPHIVTIFDQPHYPEAISLLEARYGSSSAATWEQNEWLMDKKFDEMIKDALETVDRKKRFEKCYKIQDYIVDLCPTLFIFDQALRQAYQSAYVDWPEAKGERIPIMGYSLVGRLMKVFPEKRAELLK
ncbi:MAG: hypothetical protein JRJ78_01275 [Deltaproteobacteria bacterium]|nr:hypothetical protein [Deltaproteobacteria bacterium]